MAQPISLCHAVLCVHGLLSAGTGNSASPEVIKPSFLLLFKEKKTSWQRRKSTGFGFRSTRILILVLCDVQRALSFSEPQCPHLEFRDSSSAHLQGALCGLEVVHEKSSAADETAQGKESPTPRSQACRF